MMQRHIPAEPALGLPAAHESLSWPQWGNARHGPSRHPRRILVLNRYDRPPPMAGEAEVKYLDGDFRIVRPGAFVRCAMTGVPIPLEELKYWSVDLQEAYASPEAVMKRLQPKQAR